ncbi:MAG: succinate-semialdehyde dehydrogenase [Proteobacteria bacterium]|nr:MAG: succinate-semialdehyde dehydrogenase [Pseudomonadota bacterium]PIE40475.1 MAG: succinate-semialdehyde dehydrogenase [Gammaproteobacteria bacterium]
MTTKATETLGTARKKTTRTTRKTATPRQKQPATKKSHPDTIVAINPATGEKIGEVACTPMETFPDLMINARKAQEYWGDTTFEERREHILRIQKYLIENAERISRVISQDNGKTIPDAYQTEVMPSILATDWYARKAKKILKKKRLTVSSVLAANKQTTMHRLPLGVVAVVSPWNYPWTIPFSEILMGLMAGNAIVFKTARETIMVGKEIEKAIQAANLPYGLFTHVVGDSSEITNALFDNGINKIFFTGSVRVGKMLMKQASETLTPVSLELGGNDAAIVLEDAHLERAAHGIVWGGFQNNGQTCAGVERVYVHESVADEFLRLVKEHVEELRHGVERGNFDVDIGAVTTTRQMETIRTHVDEALEQGAKILVQSRITDKASDQFYPATVLTNVDHSMKVMNEETFGPVIGVMTFKTEEEALALANDSDLGLTSSIWTMNQSRGKKLALKIEAGITTINDHVVTHGLPEIPWTGWKNSGIGGTHSHVGLEAMTQIKVVNNDLVPHIEKNLWWFPHQKTTFDALLRTPTILFGNMKDATDTIKTLLPELITDPTINEKLQFVAVRARLRLKRKIMHQIEKRFGENK